MKRANETFSDFVLHFLDKQESHGKSIRLREKNLRLLKVNLRQ